VALRRTGRVFLNAVGVCRDVIGRELAIRPMAVGRTEAG
jgi:hypothetical protein